MILFRAECAQTYPKDTNGVPIIIGCSEELVSKWYSHGIFGAEFRTWFDAMTTEFGSLQEFLKRPRGASGNKRGGEGQGSNATPKKLKKDVDITAVALDAVTGVETNTAAQAELFDIGSHSTTTHTHLLEAGSWDLNCLNSQLRCRSRTSRPRQMLPTSQASVSALAM